MRKILPHVWFEKDAARAAELYCATFPGGRVASRRKLGGTPSGEVEIIELALPGRDLVLLQAGPYLKPNPSVSFLVAFDRKDEVDRAAALLGEGGGELMALGEYPFSERYAWIADRWGLSWQLLYRGRVPAAPGITPTQMFVGAQRGRAEEALRFYTSVFRRSAVDHLDRYGEGSGPDAPESVKHAGFSLEGEGFAIMDSSGLHDFAFNEAISYLVRCEDQAEIDYYWAALSADPAAERCGWLKDRFGFSWQIVPRDMDRLLGPPGPGAAERAVAAMLAMKKLDIAALEAAGGGV